ncbi:MAG: PQQ-binding-like beta-propeller repeat protein, partial [Acidobacteriota bacterium]
MQTSKILLVAIIATLVGSQSAFAESWSQIRGPHRSGTVAGAGELARSWPASGPQELWRQTIGEGFSGIAVADQLAITGALDGEREVAIAFDRSSGEERWRTPIGSLFTEQFGNGPRSTPLIDGDRVFILSSRGQLHALRLNNGEPIWTLDFVETLGATVPQRGFCGSPILLGEQLIIEAGGSEERALIAVDRASGELMWHSGGGAASYSSPIVATIDGVQQIVLPRRFGVEGPEIQAFRTDGTLYWTFPAHPAIINMAIHVPPDRFWVSTAEDWGGVLLSVSDHDGSATVEEVWR